MQRVQLNYFHLLSITAHYLTLPAYIKSILDLVEVSYSGKYEIFETPLPMQNRNYG